MARARCGSGGLALRCRVSGGAAGTTHRCDHAAILLLALSPICSDLRSRLVLGLPQAIRLRCDHAAARGRPSGRFSPVRNEAAAGDAVAFGAAIRAVRK